MSETKYKEAFSKGIEKGRELERLDNLYLEIGPKELLVEHDKKVRADAIDESFDILLSCEIEKNDKGWDMIQIQEAMDKILQLKEQK